MLHAKIIFVLKIINYTINFLKTPKGNVIVKNNFENIVDRGGRVKMPQDVYDLDRFIKVQERTYDTALEEVSQGMKRSHWMWWIFPQITGLGMTMTSQMYSIKSLEEAKAFFAHPYLGRNLREISYKLLTLASNDAYEVFGSPDDLKLRSSMTLFAEAVPDEEVFGKVLDKFYNGKKDERTIAILKALKK